MCVCVCVCVGERLAKECCLCHLLDGHSLDDDVVVHLSSAPHSPSLGPPKEDGRVASKGLTLAVVPQALGEHGSPRSEGRLRDAELGDGLPQRQHTKVHVLKGVYEDDRVLLGAHHGPLRPLAVEEVESNRAFLLASLA